MKADGVKRRIGEVTDALRRGRDSARDMLILTTQVCCTCTEHQATGKLSMGVSVGYADDEGMEYGGGKQLLLYLASNVTHVHQTGNRVQTLASAETAGRIVRVN